MTTAYLAAEGFADQLQEELRRAGAPAIRRHERLLVCDGPAIAAGLGRQHLARLRRAAGGVDRQRRASAARHPAQLGDVRATASPPRRADPGTPAARLGQAASFSRRQRRPRRWGHGPCWRRTGCWPPRAAARPSPTARWLRRGQDRPAQPRLPQAVGGAGAARPLAGAGRALPRSRRLARRLDLGAGQAGRQRDRRRQGAARSQGGGDGRACNGAARAPSPWNPRASGRSTGCSPTSSAIRPGCCGWSSNGGRRGWCGTSSAPSSSRARPITSAAADFAAIPGAEVLHLHHNKHELTFFWTQLEGRKLRPGNLGGQSC